MSVIGNALYPNSPEIPTKYEELQYIELASGLIAFDTGHNISEFQSGSIKMTTDFYCTNYSGISGSYGYIFSYGRSAGFSAVAIRQSNGYWYIRRVRNTMTGSSTKVSLNTNLSLEYYDIANTQYLKVGTSQVVSSTLTDAVVSPAGIWIGAYQGMSGMYTVPGQYKRFQIYDGNTLKLTCVPVRRKSDSAIGYLTIDRYKNKYFATANSSGTIGANDITAGPVVT